MILDIVVGNIVAHYLPLPLPRCLCPKYWNLCLGYVEKRIKCADGNKVANLLALKQEGYSGLLMFTQMFFEKQRFLKYKDNKNEMRHPFLHPSAFIAYQVPMMVTVLEMYSFWISKTVCHFYFGSHIDNGLEKIIYLKRRQISKDQRRERPQTLGKVFECNVSFLLQSPLGGEAGCSSGTGLPSLDGVAA